MVDHSRFINISVSQQLVAACQAVMALWVCLSDVWCDGPATPPQSSGVKSLPPYENYQEGHRDIHAFCYVQRGKGHR